MKYKISTEYPDGAIEVTAKDLTKLKAKGWTINLHTPYYANFIGVKFLEMQIGFANWMSNLGFYTEVKDAESGGFHVAGGYELEIKSQDDLNRVIKYIDGIIELNKLLNDIPKKKNNDQ